MIYLWRAFMCLGFLLDHGYYIGFGWFSIWFFSCCFYMTMQLALKRSALGACLENGQSMAHPTHGSSSCRATIPSSHRTPQDHHASSHRHHVRRIHRCTTVPRRIAIPHCNTIPCTPIALHAPSIPWSITLQTSKVLLVCNTRTSLLHHQNKATATIEQSTMRESNIRKKD
jgi:hypothetical protein